MGYLQAKTVSVLLALMALVATGTTAARAQSSITFVSSSGSNANTCNSPSTACSSFSGAHNNLIDGGSITCVDPGNYGNPTITKSVTIDCRAGGGSTNAGAIMINAPGKNVRFRNLAVNDLSQGSPFAAVIDIVAAGSVHLENVF